ncbi:DUF397 domain-containing protein [Streptomyces sp. TP-A0874]|uniref:DUF397 domain-containing protein n=1 Tax=Streptomyces sp. TP-A0874 TaxID=549819 RepID=UPI0008534726|nr:DUF397 domain-containing protein [Streptomyces sp. TP-A0874]
MDRSDLTGGDRDWFKSSYSNGQAECVEIRIGADAVAMRDSKNPGGPVLSFSSEGWQEFVASAAAGAFDQM